MNTGHLKKLEELIQPAVEGQSYELVDLLWKREYGRWVFQITIDRKAGEGFISHQDCANVSREVSVLLDLHGEMLPDDYSLEVSSPGPKRPLKKSADFLRFVGHTAKIRMKEYAAKVDTATANPRRNFTGTIQAIEKDVVTLKLENQTEVKLSLNEIEKAHLLEQDE